LLPIEVPGDVRQQIARLWLEALSKYPRSKEVLEAGSNYLRFSRLEDLQRFLEANEGSEKVQLLLGEAYAYAAIDVIGQNAKGNYAVPLSMPDNASAKAARTKLEQSEQLPLLDAGYRTIYQIAWNLRSQKLVERSDSIAAFCESVFAQIYKLNPDHSGGCFLNAPDRSDEARVNGGVVKGSLIKQVPPQYPQEAKSRHIQGKIVFTAVIAKDGKIRKLGLEQGPLLLYEAAYTAVKQWEYRPYLVNKAPVEVFTEIEVNFTLN
jgi:hypothetical protein